MEFRFEVIPYNNGFSALPKHSGVYKVFDIHGKLIILDKTSNLWRRFERYYGPRPEAARDLDLREITGHIEYIRTHSTFETLYVLHQQRRKYFPKTYRKMRTFRLFNLMKINRKQRFPRIYASRHIKAGVDYFGPFITRGQFSRLKTTLERTFKLRPCLYNIRGNDPHPDCLYFQMHTCSRPCNSDIGRPGYADDVSQAILFIQGRDTALEDSLIRTMNDLSAQTRFEEAELVRRRRDKIRHARAEFKDTFFSVWEFNFLVLLQSDSVKRWKIAFVRQGSVVEFKEYELDRLAESIDLDLHRFFDAPAEPESNESRYDEFCLVANFIIDPLQNVDLIPVDDTRNLAARVVEKIHQRTRRNKRKPQADRRTDVEEAESAQ